MWTEASTHSLQEAVVLRGLILETTVHYLLGLPTTRHPPASRAVLDGSPMDPTAPGKGDWKPNSHQSLPPAISTHLGGTTRHMISRAHFPVPPPTTGRRPCSDGQLAQRGGHRAGPAPAAECTGAPLGQAGRGPAQIPDQISVCSCPNPGPETR